MRKSAGLLLTFFGIAFNSFSQTTVVLNPVKDNTLYESPTGALSNGKGVSLFSGRTNQTSNYLRRALLQFDIAGNIPAGSTINSVTLTLKVDKTGTGPQNTTIHKVTADWGEGNSLAGPTSDGDGVAAQTNDATWLHRFSPSTFWTIPGGDFDQTPSASASVGSTGTSTIWNTVGLIVDVHNWLVDGSTNFGWLVKGEEGAVPSAKSFFSREATNAVDRPKLTIIYTLPCIDATITSFVSVPPSVCEGTGASLKVTGSLNSATAWHLYSSSCGGTFVTSNTSGEFNVFPTETTTYFVRGEGGCVTPGTCSSVEVTVTPSEDPSFHYSNEIYCQNDTDPTPTITGVTGGLFNSLTAGLSINLNTGQVDLSASLIGSYSIRYRTPGACPDSTDVLLTVSDVIESTSTKTICQGEEFVFGTQTLTNVGQYSETFQSESGCDSTVTLTLVVNPTFTKSTTASICQGDQYSFGAQTLTVAGLYQEIFQSKTGCDSTVNLTLAINSTFTTAVTATICNGENYQLGTQTLTTAGLYSEVFQSKAGCDSTINLTLQVTQVNTAVNVVTEDATLTADAEGASYQWLNCNNANQPISGETNQSFLAEVTGSYAVEVTQNSCTETSSCFNIVITGIRDSELSGISIYPNPVTKKVTINFNAFQSQVLLSLTDLNGKQLVEGESENCYFSEINTDGISPGLYLLNVQSGGRKKVVRVWVR